MGYWLTTLELISANDCLSLRQNQRLSPNSMLVSPSPPKAKIPEIMIAIIITAF